MLQRRIANERGQADHGWLDARHTFSFAEYYEPEQMGFRALRVMNEDRIQPGRGFGMHPHRDMEIVTYILSGALEHKDSMGNGEVLRAGELQRMSAGTGIVHSEFNHSSSELLHLYQIWLLPRERGITPSYEQKSFTDETSGRLRLVASPDAADGSLRIHQDARIYLSRLDRGATLDHALAPGRHAWLQVLRGTLRVNGTPLQTSDGAALSDEQSARIEAESPAEVMLFDLA